MSLHQTEIIEAESNQPELDPFEEMEAERDKKHKEPFLKEEDMKEKSAKPKESSPQKSAQVKTEEKETEDAQEDTKKESKKKIDVSPDDDEEEDQVTQEATEVKKLKTEIEKKTKALTDTQKWGNKNAQKVKEALKITNQLIEDSYLSSDEAQSLLKVLSSEQVDQEEEDDILEKTSTPLKNILRIARPEIENIWRYTEDEMLDKKVHSFDMLLNFSTPEEKEQIIDEIYALKDDPVKMTKRMLSLGQKYYEEVYKDFTEAGGLKQYAAKQSQVIEKMQKRIDKLSKKLQEYEDHDSSPKYILDEGRESNNDNSRADLDDFDHAKHESDFKQRMSVARR